MEGSWKGDESGKTERAFQSTKWWREAGKFGDHGKAKESRKATANTQMFKVKKSRCSTNVACAWKIGKKRALITSWI